MTAARLSPDTYELLMDRLRHTAQFLDAGKEAVAAALALLEEVHEEEGDDG